MTINVHEELSGANFPTQIYWQQKSKVNRLQSPSSCAPVLDFDLTTSFLSSNHVMNHQMMAEAAPTDDFLKRPLKRTDREENTAPPSPYASLHARQQSLNRDENPKIGNNINETMFYPSEEEGGMPCISESTSETTAATTITKTTTSKSQEEESTTERNQFKRSRESDVDYDQDLESASAYEEDVDRKRSRRVNDNGNESNLKQRMSGEIIISTASSKKDTLFPMTEPPNPKSTEDEVAAHMLGNKNTHDIQKGDDQRATISEDKDAAVSHLENIPPGVNPSRKSDGSNMQMKDKKLWSTFPSFGSSTTNPGEIDERNKQEVNEDKRRATTEDSLEKKRTSSQPSFHEKSKKSWTGNLSTTNPRAPNDKHQKPWSDFNPAHYQESSGDHLHNGHFGPENANDGSSAMKTSDYRYAPSMGAPTEEGSHETYHQGEAFSFGNAHERDKGYDKNGHPNIQHSYSFPPPNHPPSDPSSQQPINDHQIEEPLDSWQAFMNQKDMDEERRTRSSSWSPQGVSSKASSYSASSSGMAHPRQTYQQHSTRPSSNSYPQSQNHQQQGNYYDSRHGSAAPGNRLHREGKEGGNERGMKTYNHHHGPPSDDVKGASTHPHHYPQYNHYEPPPQERYPHHAYEPQQHAEGNGNANDDQFYPPPHHHSSEHQHSWPMYPPVPPLNEAGFLADDGEVIFPDPRNGSSMKSSSSSRSGNESSRTGRGTNHKRGKVSSSSRSRNQSSSYYHYPYDGVNKQYPGGHYNPPHPHQQFCHPVSRPDSSSALTRPSSNTSKGHGVMSQMHDPQQFPMQPYYNRDILALSTDEDENWLSEFLCFVRSQCVEVFSATKDDVASRMNSKKVLLSQVGIRCRFCAHIPHRERTGRSSSFPSSISRIYQSLTMMLRDHFTKCHMMPRLMKERYLCLKANASQGATDSKKYWVESAHNLGLVDTEEGIRFTCDTFQSADENVDQRQRQHQHPNQQQHHQHHSQC